MPETGVTIIENAKIKGGQKDYFQKYQKFSKVDYYKMMVNILITQGKLCE
jgi:hypothetical protein